MQYPTLTAAYLDAAGKALALVQEQARVRWLDDDDVEHTAILRGWADREEDVRDRLVRTTSLTGFEDTVTFQDLVDYVARYRIAKA